MGEDALHSYLDDLRVGEASSAEFTVDTAKALAKLGWQHSIEPGLWAVKWVQGAVAGGARQVHFTMKERRLEAHGFGNLEVCPKQLMEMLLGGQIPAERLHRHWVSALHGVFGLKPERVTLRSLLEPGILRTVTVEKGELRLEDVVPESEDISFSLTVDLPKPRPWKRWSKVWSPVAEALAARLRYCSIPVLLERVLVSQQSPFDIPETLLSWLSPSQESEHGFTVTADINQIIAPSLLPPTPSAAELHHCSLMINVRRELSYRGMAEAYWIRDGALIGPVIVRGPTGAIGVDIICPGDHPTVNLSEWAIQDPETFFPDQRILEVTRQLVHGLESLLGTVSDSLERSGWASALRTSTPDARLLKAFDGSVLEALQSFSDRSRLVLTDH